MALPVTETTSALVRRQRGSDGDAADAPDGAPRPLAGVGTDPAVGGCEAAAVEAEAEAAAAVGDDDDVLRILDALPLDGSAPAVSAAVPRAGLDGDGDGADDTEGDWDGDALTQRKDPVRQLQQRLGKKFVPAPSALRDGFKGPAAAYTSSSLSSFAEAAVVGDGHVSVSYPAAPDRCGSAVVR